MPAINIGDLVVTEGESGQKQAFIPFILSTPSNVPITFLVTTSDGTAKANVNYVPLNAVSITIPAHTITGTIPVTILGNSVFRGDTNFFVNITNPFGATVNKDKATVTIVDPNGVMGATQFLVSLNPQSKVGTYSYTVQPLVSDRIRVPFFQALLRSPSATKRSRIMRPL